MQIIYPTNSFGQICGSGDLKDRPVLLFFDIIQCLNVATLATGCPTPQACVKKCPKEAFSGLALAHSGKETEAKEGMRDYCFKMSDELWEEKSVEDDQAGETQEEVDPIIIDEEDNIGDGLTTVENSSRKETSYKLKSKCIE